jgi:REP element-mobilizing transposase RayT
MARSPRPIFPGAVYHLVTRGNNRRTIFADDYDRACFLGLLNLVVGSDGFVCHAYCLMSNHYHLLVDTPAANVALGMQRLNSRYSHYFNRRHGRINHLFGQRYHSELVESDAQLLETARYIVLNPLRARLCTSPAAWPWSSYLATAGRRSAPPFLTTSWLLGLFAKLTPVAESRYVSFVDEGVADLDTSRSLAPGMARKAGRREPRSPAGSPSPYSA